MKMMRIKKQQYFPSTIFIYNPIVDGKRNGCIAIAVKFKESKLAKKALH
jgi:hypothetical protein